jgi:lipoprotein-anchoring transpeptidase ErfK/SrfK/peptidoglycan hydrolase-like protein with peptidoglycan-binding domain
MRIAALFALFVLVGLATPMCAFAQTRPSVAALQVAFHARGFYRGPVDGRLGPKTRQALRNFQRRRGLRIDGVPGHETRAALGPYGRHELGSRFLHVGATGWDVAELQFILASRGFPAVHPDGHYGVQTTAAIRRFQRRARITADGVAGPATFVALDILAAQSGFRSAAVSNIRAAAGIIPAAAGRTAQPVGRQRAVVLGQLRRPVRFALGMKSWWATPSDLGARATAGRAPRSHASTPTPKIKQTISVDRRRVRAYVDHLASIFDRRPVDARLVGLRHLRPRLAPERAGVTVEREAAVAMILRRLTETGRGLVRLPYRRSAVLRTRASFGSIIVVRRRSHRLYLYSGTRLSRVFRVGTGRRGKATPIGRFVIVSKARDPWWYPPSGLWAKRRSVIPPGPGNPLGTRWMGLSAPEVGIHGTPDAASVGYSRSHGCIHMGVRDVEWLFERVSIGTPVIIVRV